MVSVTLSVPVPVPPQVTVTWLLPVPAVMAPPEIVQAYPFPNVLGVEYIAEVENSQTVYGPVITGAGLGLIVTL